MDFRKLKELVDSIPENQLDYEVELNFITETKTGNGLKTGRLEGVLFVDNLPLKFIGIEINNNW